MPNWFPRSILGAVLSGIYILVALYAVADARSNEGGGWITLKGIGVFLVTLPVSMLGEALGVKPDYRRNFDMAVVIGACAVIVYCVGAAIERAARRLL